MAGRTDAGVHAIGQVVSWPDAPDSLDIPTVRDAVNRICGPSIVVTDARPADPGFHARFSALSRTYIYAVLERPAPDPWLSKVALWHPLPLDVAAMQEGAGHLLGSHDFSSFGRVAEGTPPTRTLFELSCTRSGDVIRIVARANAFIQQMVRALAGTLLEVGVGKRDPDEMPGILAARDRGAAGVVAPPHALCLVAVEYDEGWSSPRVV